MKCIFCHIVSGALPSFNVYEDAHTLGFLDIYGATDGHSMVIHKKHGDKIFDYTQDEIKEIFTAVQKVAQATEKAFSTKILSIGINHGEPAGVRHMHVHIMPRYEGDNGGIMQKLPARPLKSKNFSEIAEKLRKAGV